MRCSFVFVALLVSVSALGATDGEPGSRSTGSLEIRLTVAPAVRLSGLSDLQLADHGGATATAATPVCVQVRGASSYQLRAITDSGSAGFALTNGSKWAPYRVHYSTGTQRHELQPNLPLQGLRSVDQRAHDCSANGPNGRLDVALTAASRQTLGAGVYSGTLSLMVAPE